MKTVTPDEKPKEKRRRSNAGQIIRRGEKTFVCRIYQGEDENGRRRYLNHTVKGSKKDAEAWLTSKLRDKHLGINIEPAAESLNTYLDKWLESAAKPRVRPRTFEDYQALLKRYVREPLGAIKLSDLRALDIQQLYTSMQTNGLSGRVVRYTHAVLSSALKQAVKWDMLVRNPAALVDLPRLERREIIAMSRDEARRFLSAVKENKAAALFTFALDSGFRPQEYLALKWTDLDLEKGTATVRRAIVWSKKKGGGWRFAEPKTSKSRRTIPLFPATIKALTEHRRHQLQDRLRAGTKWQDLGLVFTTPTGAPFDIPSLNKAWFKPALVKAELPSTFPLYCLRHTMATHWLANGENPKVVSERLGHSTIVLTLDTYCDVLPGMQESAVQRLEKILFG